MGDSIDALTVEASGENLHYAWKKDGAPLGETSDTLSLGTATATTQSGTYTVTVSNSGGSDTKSVTITVHDAAPVITGGTVTGGPYHFTVGDVANFTVVASGADLHYHWRKDGADIGTDSASLALGATTSPSQGGTYSVVVSNSGGTDTASAVLTVADIAPVITSTPGMGGPYTVGDGAVINLGVTATGTNLVYEWFDDGVSVGPGGANHNFGYRYYADYGSYPVSFSVVVSNAAGTDSDAASVTITE